MPRDKRDRRVNPFRIGGIGLLLLVAGLVLKTRVAGFMENAEQQRILARLQAAAQASAAMDPADIKAVQVVERASRYYQTRMHWELAGQLVFFAGLGLVLAAGVIWYQQAQQPEPLLESEDEPNPEANGLPTFPPHSPYSS
jgi:hypothetical protein